MDHHVDSTAHDNARQHDQEYPITQYYSTSMQPPGAENADLHPPAHFPHAESSLQDLFAQTATEMSIPPIPPSDVYHQGEGFGMASYAQGFPNQIPPSSRPIHESDRRPSSHGRTSSSSRIPALTQISRIQSSTNVWPG